MARKHLLRGKRLTRGIRRASCAVGRRLLYLWEQQGAIKSPSKLTTRTISFASVRVSEEYPRQTRRRCQPRSRLRVLVPARAQVPRRHPHEAQRKHPNGSEVDQAKRARLCAAPYRACVRQMDFGLAARASFLKLMPTVTNMMAAFYMAGSFLLRGNYSILVLRTYNVAGVNRICPPIADVKKSLLHSPRTCTSLVFARVLAVFQRRSRLLPQPQFLLHHLP